MGFQVDIQSLPQQEIITLTGDLDENSSFSSVMPKGGKQLIIDLKGVRHINSLGLRNWVNWVKTLQELSRDVYLRNCPVIAVNQINILEGFLPAHAVVESVDVPFLCESCGASRIYTAVRGKDFMEFTSLEKPEKIMLPMAQPCALCGAIAEADVVPDKYFKFLKRKR